MTTKTASATQTEDTGITPATLALLTAPVPEELISHLPPRSADAKPMKYVGWPYVASRLDAADPNWSYSIVGHPVTEVVNGSNGDPVVLVTVTAELTICGVTRQASAAESARNPGDFEKAVGSAETAALKRAAAKFGVARDLYEKPPVSEEEAIQKAGGGRGYASRSSAPAQGGGSAPRQGGGGAGWPLKDAQKKAFFAISKAGQFGSVQEMLDFLADRNDIPKGKTENDNWQKAEVDAVFALGDEIRNQR